jgi:LuxR family maltose regulon positive regulatory protein
MSPGDQYRVEEPPPEGSSPSPEGSSLLAVKRAVPRRPPGYVARPRLLDRLDETTASTTLTVIRGPAGAGKTALAAAWAERAAQSRPVAWLSLSPSDANRGRFWRHVLLALHELDAGRELDSLAFSSTARVDQFVVGLVEALTRVDTPVVLVLDDLDELTDPALLDDVERLLRTPPRGLRIVATSRGDSPLRLARLRVIGTVTEIPAEELAFTRDEAGELLTASAELDPAQADRVWERTEGWAAGLALVALSLRPPGDPGAFIDGIDGDQAPVADYLLEEVLEHETRRTRQFLLETATTTAICGDLADAMTGRTGGGGILADLCRRGVLLTALDDHHDWYRYHPLFASMMRTTLRREDPERVAVLHARAAAWLGAAGKPVAAARHAIAAGDLDLLARITAEHAFTMVVAGEFDEFGAILRTLPAEELQARPTLALATAGAALERGDARTAEAWLARADDAVARLPDGEHRRRYELGRAVAGLYLARLTGAQDEAMRAAAAFTPQGPRPHGDDLHALSLVHLGALQLWTGEIETAARNLSEGATIAARGGRAYLELYGLALLAVAQTWAGLVPEGRHTAERAIELATRRGWRTTPRAGTALVVLSYAASAGGDLENALRLHAEAVAAMAAGVELPLRAQVTMQGARLDRLDGRPLDAAAANAQARDVLRGTPFLLPLAGGLDSEEGLALHAAGETERAIALLRGSLAERATTPQVPVALGRVLLDRDEPGEALALAEPWTTTTVASQRTARIHALLVCARAHQALDDEEAALAAMRGALTVATPFDRRLPFLEHGDAVADLLRRSEVDVAGPIGQHALARDVRERTLVLTSAPSPPRDELSERELAILRYLPSTLSNREIAEELIVSINTVKTHIKSIYAKLDAHDRRAAVRRARSLGLLPRVD